MVILPSLAKPWAAEGSILALPWLSGAAVTTGLIGAGANTGIQYLANGKIEININAGINNENK
ncbi:MULTISPECIES: hypothetical protein [Photorhabdus]|uniref:hypothetical protein n=1 Tax=Photorhabdus TaxID=29487 RepID=UPI00139205B0|nr:hypothetical protein [Photorhabdus asymbiotica]